MEEEIREQPETEDQAQGTAVQNEMGEDDSSKQGSLGKFKDAQSLYSAYNNLQAEFTRRCQRLSELEKTAKVAEEGSDAPVQNLRLNDVTSSLTQTNCEVSNQETVQQEVQPVYKSEDWNKQVLEFLAKNEDAKPFAKDICNEIVNDENISKSSDALSLAWAKIIQKNYKKPSDIVSDEFIDNYVVKNEKVKQKVIELLAKEISQNKVPKTVGAHAGSQINLPKFSQPLTMADAKEMARRLME